MGFGGFGGDREDKLKSEKLIVKSCGVVFGEHYACGEIIFMSGANTLTFSFSLFLIWVFLVDLVGVDWDTQVGYHRVFGRRITGS